MPRRLALALTTAVLAAMLALMGVAAGAPADGGLVRTLAAGQCGHERKALGKKAFRKRYGEKGMPACIRKGRAAARRAISVASQECQAQLEEWGPEFYEDWDSLEECVADVAAWELDGGGIGVDEDDGEEPDDE